MKITLGKDQSGRAVHLDLEILLRTRLLLQANSGGGKSWLIRRLAEQISGKVPQYIIDPEGEFSSLRPQFPFVLVGEGGETTPDPRAAELLAHRLLDLRVSAIFDLSELKPQVRAHWTKVYLEALIELPRRLRTHHIVYLDEAHMFAPEGGKSEAFGAVVDVATRGRKRGTCLIAATQRLSKLTKDVTGELLNRMIGPTFEDLDLERAEHLLSITRADRLEFEKRMRVLPPGNFEALGRAFGTERMTVKVGPVETTHPEVGKSRRMKAPPAAIPEKIKALLPKLADLPKEAEDKAKGEAELRKEIRTLKAELASSQRIGAAAVRNVRPPTPPPPPAKIKPVEVRVIPPAQLLRVERAMQKANEAAGRCQDAVGHLRGFSDLIMDNVKKVEAAARRPEPPHGPLIVKHALIREHPPATPFHRKATVPAEPPPKNGEGTSDAPLPSLARRILKALLFFEEVKYMSVKRSWVAGWLSVSYTSGGFRNTLGFLRTSGLISYPSSDALALTGEGRTQAGQLDMAPADILPHCEHAISGQQAKILRIVHGAFPESVTRDQVAEALNVSVTSGGFRNSLGGLRTAGMISYPDKQTLRCSDWMFEFALDVR